jgi:hypothetical protein
VTKGKEINPMKIKINASELKNGRIMVKSIEATRNEPLPGKYKDAEPNVYVDNNKQEIYLALRTDGCNMLKAGLSYSKEYFNEQIVYCNKSIDRLKKIRFMLEKEEKEKAEMLKEVRSFTIEM